MLDIRAMIDNAPPETVADKIAAAWASRARRYPSADAARKRAETAAQLERELRDE